MLGRQVAEQFGGRVRFVVENFGESQLAERFGIRRYPAIFVDDVLVAKPKDFGFSGPGGSQGEGRYTPWRDEANQERFKQDLVRMVKLALADEQQRLREEHGTVADSTELNELPSFTLDDLRGRPLTRQDLLGRVAIVEFWATWCPPCQGTLAWLGELRRDRGDEITVVAVAVESPADDVRAATEQSDPNVRWVLGTDDVVRAFGDVLAVPTLLVFDRHGRLARTFQGAPPGLHSQVTTLIDELVSDTPQARTRVR